MRFAFLFCLLLIAPLRANEVEVQLGQAFDAQTVLDEQHMADLAQKVLDLERTTEASIDLNHRFRLQMLVGDFDSARESILRLRAERVFENERDRVGYLLPYQVLIEALSERDQSGKELQRGFAESFARHFAALDDPTSLNAQFAFGAHVGLMQQSVRDMQLQLSGKTALKLTDALEWLRRYQVATSYAQIVPFGEQAIAHDDARRYVVDRNVLIKTPDGAQIAALMVRPKTGSLRRPTLLNFTIYADLDWKFQEAKASAAQGYVGIAAFTRGKGASPDQIVPYEYDGADANAVIDWISKQDWSDARVGMWGGSYEGFTQWAAAKHRHPALKAIMPTAAAAPGIDVPMENGVFQSFVYRWLPYVTNNKSLDFAVNNDAARWARLQETWFTSGRAYRELPAIDGHPSPWFLRWLEHPQYDEYWQRMIPYQREFAQLDVDVLSVSGYFDGALVSTIYYFDALEKYRPKGKQFLVVGPFDHFGTQARPAEVVNGYQIDSSARIDIEALRFAWFDHIFADAPLPELLQAPVNFQVLGADRWAHAATLDRIPTERRRYFLDTACTRMRCDLKARAPSGRKGKTHHVDLAQRVVPDPQGPPLAVRDHLVEKNALVFVSDAMVEAIEWDGLFSADLRLRSNRQDFDFSLSLYELNEAGEYFEVSYFLGRASQLRDRTQRRLLKLGRRERLRFQSGRLMAKRVPTGSRLIVVLAVSLDPSAQINHGSGKPVSAETVEDAAPALVIEWLPGSNIELPLRRD